MAMSINELSKMVKKIKMHHILIILILLYVLKPDLFQSVKEGFEQIMGEPTGAAAPSGPKEIAGPGPSASKAGPKPVPALGKVKPNDGDDMEYATVGAKQEVNLPTCSQFVSSNLLPKDDPKLDASFTEFSHAKELEGQNFIDTNKYAIGMQSQTLRNANHQLRSDPPISNTMACASPWNNTTIDKEARRPLSIGAA